jgi:hypothetical protein
MTPFQATRVPGACVHPPRHRASPPIPGLGRGAGGRIVNFSEPEYRAVFISPPDSNASAAAVK